MTGVAAITRLDLHITDDHDLKIKVGLKALGILGICPQKPIASKEIADDHL